MRTLREWARRLWGVLSRRRSDRDLEAELRLHLDLATEDARRRGQPADEAARAARIRSGGLPQAMDALRDQRGLPWLEHFARDLRLAVRTLRRHPGFSAVVVLTLGFGIAINTATFSIVNAVLIRPLGFREPARLAVLHEDFGTMEPGPFSPPDFLDLERDQRSFDGVAAYVNVAFELSGAAQPIRVDGAKVSANLFAVLGVGPILGRTFTAEEDRPGVNVAVLGWGLWQSRYGQDPAVIGRRITLDRQPYTVIGVMPATFEFPLRGPQWNNRPAAVWVPMAFTEGQRQARGNQFNHGVVARLKDGVTLDEARADLDVLTPRILANYPAVLREAKFSVRLSMRPLREDVAGRIERPLLLVMVAVGLVLLVTCANVANLVLSRVASRTREVAVRTALGASRGRLLQLLLAEAAVLSAAGALVGVSASRLIVGAVPAAMAGALPGVRDVPIDLRVLAFTAAIGMATSIFFALVPAVAIDWRAPGTALQEEVSRSTPGRRRHRLQAGLVVSTVALAVVLLVGAGLFIRSFSALMATDAGFNADRVLTASLTLPRAGYGKAASVRAFQAALLTRASSLPGAHSAALVTDLPLETYEHRTLSAEGGGTAEGAPGSTNLSWVYGPYFQALGIRLRSGRVFSDIESVEARNVVVVNERLARALWPGQDAVGRRIRWGIDVPENRNPWLTVVGVIGDVVDGPLGSQPSVHAYEPFSQFPDAILDNIPNAFGRHVKVAIRTSADPRALASPLRAAIATVDRELAIESIATMADRVGDGVAPRRFSALTLGGFAAGSLLLAAIGLYGLLAFNVAERRREVAVRLALGAKPSTILRMVVGDGLRLVSIGLVAGALASYAAARAVASFLYQTESHDLVTFGTVAAVLVLVTLTACALPAYRASRVAPIAALRAD
jgi:putative ABC transport system permease protein